MKNLFHDFLLLFQNKNEWLYYMTQPNKGEWHNTFEAFPVLKNLKIELPISNNDYTLENINAYADADYLKNDWQRHMNTKLSNLKITYILFIHYFNKGIPDDENENGEHFSNFTHKDRYNKYFFDYYTENLYYYRSSAYDFIFHALNTYYDFKIEKSPGFTGKIMKKLETKNKNLYDFLDNTKKDAIHKEGTDFRDDFTHNFLPNRPGIGFHRRGELITFGGRSYTSSKEIKNNVDGLITLLEQALRELEKHLIIK